MTGGSRSLPESPWLRLFQPRPDARARLVCLPHAGGSASFFRRWLDHLSDMVELVVVQYPGRENRIDDPLIDTMPVLIDALMDEMSPILDRPYLLFGHSMGATVAHELCLALAHCGKPLPSHLVVSAKEAPIHHQEGSWHRASDAVLWRELGRLGGMSPELLDFDDLRDLLLPAIRSDYRLIETYRPAPVRACLPTPIRAFVGRDDTELTAAQAADWSTFCSGGFQLHQFPGGHFYIKQYSSRVVTTLMDLMGCPCCCTSPITSPLYRDRR
ncbi:MAG: thioesterase [Telmatospirillum sp.]|nr:thioesterase [Telmatospirillum sp.]